MGLPNILGRNKSTALGFLKDKVRQRVQSWDGRWISQAGREVLVKSVVQALPTYAMSVFLIPMNIIKDLERMISKYWWGASSTGAKKIHWLSWSELSKHKSVGGLGFRDFRDFNLSMLGKQAWRILSNPDSLVAQIYKARYFPNSSFLEASLGNNPSFIWRSVWEAKAVITAGARWKVGMGNKINIVGQPWLPDDQHPYVTSDLTGLEQHTVSSLMCMDCKEWDVDILRDMFNARDQGCIASIQLSITDEDDRWYWSKENSGQSSVKSAYRLLQAQKNRWHPSNLNSFRRDIWKVKAPPKVLNTIWRAMSNCLPTMTVLWGKFVPVETLCPVCKREDESIVHALIECEYSSRCWQEGFPDIRTFHSNDFAQWLQNMFQSAGQRRHAEIVTLCWAIWTARNEFVWNQKQPKVQGVLASAKSYLTQWKNAQTWSSKTLFQSLVEGDGVDKWVKPQVDTVLSLIHI